jgi:hypothetical protein
VRQHLVQVVDPPPCQAGVLQAPNELAAGEPADASAEEGVEMPGGERRGDRLLEGDDDGAVEREGHGPPRWTTTVLVCVKPSRASNPFSRP